MNDKANPTGFAPEDITDGREPLEWKSGYPDDAKRAIRIEAIYISVLFLCIPFFILLVWLEFPQKFLRMEVEQYSILCRYLYGWLGGMFGGTMYVIKWLYHTVAKRIWHLDRRLWRIFTPHISGGLAFVMVLLIQSRLFNVFDPDALKYPSSSIAIGFLVGYFSDTAVAKLYEVAQTIFGTTEKHQRKRSSK